MVTSLQELVQTFLNEKGFNSLFSHFREKYRSYGNIGKNTKVILESPSLYERKTLERFFGEIYKNNESITVTGAKFEKAIMKTKYKDSFEGYDINDLLQIYYGGYLTSKREDKHNFEQQKEQFFQYFMNRSDLDSPFYMFVKFIKDYSNAPSVHIMYKKDSELLKRLLELIDKLFGYLPLSRDVFLPLLAHELTDDFHALDPRSEGGKMMLFALQVLNHVNSGAAPFSKLDEEQIKGILQGYRILFCPDANRITHRLRISKGKNGEVHNYQLIALEKIGYGAFAEVYRVFDTVLQRELACKVLYDKSHFLQMYGKEGGDYLQRFKREVKLLQEKIFHQNIIGVHKIKLEDEPALFTMPLAETSLDKWLELNPAISEEERLSIYKDILSGVAYLHNYKISHRDLAPHNILLFKKKDGTILAKVSDFGLAKDHRSLSTLTGLSVSGYGRGGFTAPEQMKSLKNADHLSDIYSLGALFYYIFSGKSPEQRFTSPIKYQLIVGKAMEEDRSQRYQTVGELMDDINQFNKKILTKDDEHSFYSLKTYEFKDFSVDVIHVLNCVSRAQIETPNEVLEKFIKPFISIPREIIIECAKYETVMIPFMHITRKNISRAMDCSEEEWNQISLLADGIYKGAQNLGVQINSISLIIIVALEMKNRLAQSILVKILGSLVSQSEISQQVAYIIEKDFSSYQEILISLLKDIQYPLDIRDVLNDY